MGHCGESPKHDGLRYYFEEASRLGYDRAKEVLNFERAARDVYRDAWKKADSLYKVRRKKDPSHQQWSVMKENFVAIMCYTLETPNVCRHFNQLCRAATPTKESWNSFPFKSLLYFLIDAFIRLPDFHAPVVFRGVDKFVYSDNEARFSQFLSASVSARQAAKFGRGVFHLVLQGIPASLVKYISPYAIYPLHEEVLIWPFCVFTLTAGQEEGVQVLKFDHRKTWTSAGAVTSSTTATRRSLGNLTDKIYRDLSGQCHSSNQSSLKAVPGPSTGRMNVRSNAGQVCAHMQPNTLAPPHQVMRGTVIYVIRREPSSEHSVRAPARRPTWNPYGTPVAARHNLNQTRVRVEWERMGTRHEEHEPSSSFNNHRDNSVSWIEIAGVFLIGLILLFWSPLASKQ